MLYVFPLRGIESRHAGSIYAFAGLLWSSAIHTVAVRRFWLSPSTRTLNVLSLGDLDHTPKAGSTGDDDMEAIAADPAGRIALAGYTDGVWGGSESNAGFNDFVAVVLDTNSSATPTEEDQPAVDSTLILAGVSVAVAVGALIAAGVWIRKRRGARTEAKVIPTSHASGVDDMELAPPHRPEGDDRTVSGASSYDFGENLHPGLSISSRAVSSGGLSIADAMIEAAAELARNCQVPGVSEAATLMSTLTRLVSDSRDNSASHDAGLRRCRSIITMLECAAEILGQVRVAFNSEC